MKSFFLFLLLSVTINVLSQSNVTYTGIIGVSLIIESITLYPDRRFKWTSEFSLLFSEYGNYKIRENILQFDFYISFVYPKTMSLRDSISQISKSFEIRIYEIDENRLYPVSDIGRRITKMKNPGVIKMELVNWELI